jgi:DNA-directed RNA polymerase specialized sigma24 family protein
MPDNKKLDGLVDSQRQLLSALKQYLNDTAGQVQSGSISPDDFALEVIFTESTCRFLSIVAKFHCKYTGEDPDEIAQSVAAELCIRSGGSMLDAVQLNSANWTTYLEKYVRNKLVDERRRRTRRNVINLDEGEGERGEGLMTPNQAILEKKRVDHETEDKITIEQIRQSLSPIELRLLHATLRDSAEESGTNISAAHRLKRRLIRSLQAKYRKAKSL